MWRPAISISATFFFDFFQGTTYWPCTHCKNSNKNIDNTLLLPRNQQPFILLFIWWITFFRHLYDNGVLKEFNKLCKHMTNVRNSQPCISINFVLNPANHNFFHVSIVNFCNSYSELKFLEKFIIAKNSNKGGALKLFIINI